MAARQTCAAALVLAVTCAAAGPAAAQDPPLDARLAQVAGISPDAATSFFETLRRTVGRDERAEACALIAYPLRHADGDVPDAAACEARYESIFTIDVRKAIGRQLFDELFVNQSGVMIGSGEVWFAGRCASAPCSRGDDIKVVAINSVSGVLVPPEGKVLLACLVSGQRVVVAADGQGGASLRVWRPARFTGPPDLTFPHAEPPGPPSECGARSWTFADGTRTYLVSDLPCDAYRSPPPMGSVGRVTLSTPASPGVPLWCAEIVGPPPAR